MSELQYQVLVHDGVRRQREQRDNYHDDARCPGSSHEAMHRNQGCNDENSKCNAPVAGNCSYRQAQQNVHYMCAADEDEILADRFTLPHRRHYARAPCRRRAEPRARPRSNSLVNGMILRKTTFRTVERPAADP